MLFDDLDLNPEILESIDYMGYRETTPIQEKAIPVIMAGKDLIACAQTGTGKTAAFLVPLLSFISEKRHGQTHRKDSSFSGAIIKLYFRKASWTNSLPYSGPYT